MLFDPRAHEPLAEARWNRSAAESEIRTIAREAEDGMRAGDWWAVHPLDALPGDPDVFHGVYLGAAGVLWALEWLTRADLHEPRHHHARLALEALDSYSRRPELGGPSRSLWLGGSGITLVAWLLSRRAVLVERLAELVAADDDADTLELMSGSPGLLVVADVMRAGTGDPRFSAAAERIGSRLMRQCGERVAGLWTQRLGGSCQEFLGAAHGSAGIVAALARASDRTLPPVLVEGVTDALERTASRAGGQANWPRSLHEPLRHHTGTIRTQWCHGAPGVVASLAGLPPETRLDSLLLAGGELIWAAGPLRKGAGLCHGTAGNGFALLKLFTRTGDELWLERARRFAAHVVAQVTAGRRRYGHGHHTLWTGDLGAALFLKQCLVADSQMPCLDAW